MSSNSRPRRLLWALPVVLGVVTAALAQPDTAAPVPQAADSAASTPSAPTQRVEITAGRPDEAAQRRQASAAKIVVGREDIERFGDSTTSDVLKRLPGVTVPGPGGRGGGPRLRGLGGGYTQLLIDGERVAPGFSIDSIAPEQIERIEILRAPTAETGARAIAGSINIVLREGFRKRRNELRLSTQIEHGQTSPSLHWSRNDTLDAWTVNLSLSAFRRAQDNQTDGETRRQDIATDSTTLLRLHTTTSLDTRQGLHASGRLQWRDDDGTSVLLQPLLIYVDGDNTSRSTQDDVIADPNDPPTFARSQSLGTSRFALARLNAQVNHRLAGGVRLEWRTGLSDRHWRNASLRQEFDAAGSPSRTIDDRGDNRDRNASLSLKASTALGDDHSLVGGVEFERNRRVDARTTLWDGVPQLPEFGTDLAASARRYALYAQDEWNLTPQWSAHAGLRTEGITTQGVGANGESERNVSRVTTPLLHAVWRPEPKSRDQIRASLTRSYRSPDLNQLIGRPGLNTVDPSPGANTVLSADTAGNPGLRPEVAIGIELAFERYLSDGGVLSANFFQRRITDLIRDVVALEAVSWSPGTPRWVSRPQNIGAAVAQGLELEAKMRLSAMLANAPQVDLRANLSLFTSRVKDVAGPDNRLASQPGGTLNLGADYRLRGLPLTLGGNLNHTPGYTTRLANDRWALQADKTVVDAYALWIFRPDLQLRLSLSNALAQDYFSQTRVEASGQRETASSNARSYVSGQLRLELKL